MDTDTFLDGLRDERAALQEILKPLEAGEPTRGDHAANVMRVADLRRRIAVLDTAIAYEGGGSVA